MKTLKKTSLKDLLTNDDFIRYTFDDIPSNSQMNKETRHSESIDFQQKIKEAKEILLGRNQQYTLSQEELEKLKQKIFKTLKLAEKMNK